MAKVYAGLFDDRFDKYPNGYPRNEKFHEDNLINSLLLGDTLYINDGYVFQHPQLVKWLEQGENTLLYQMCQFGYVKFLQRDQNVEFWRIIIHLTFVLTGVVFAGMEILSEKRHELQNKDKFTEIKY